MGSCSRDWERNKLVMNELTQAHEYAKHLRNFFTPSSPAEVLTEKILCSLQKALSMLDASEGDHLLLTCSPTGSVSGSPRSESSNLVFRDAESKELCKKRKTMAQWSESVRVSPGASAEGPPDDGKCWRKYGQKDILGAKYPRAYYRCTHRHVQGCMAKKQVQRSEEDPSVFQVIYHGTHTCSQAPTNQILAWPAVPKLQEAEQRPAPIEEVFLNFQTGPEVKTGDLNCQDLSSSSFTFPCASLNGQSENNRDYAFSTSGLDNQFMGSFSTPFISPTTSESNYFSVSPCQMSSYSGGPNLQTSGSDLNEIISAVTSASNSSLVDLEFFNLDQFKNNPDFLP